MTVKRKRSWSNWVRSFPARLYLQWQVRPKDFCIFSNDCFAGEIYYWLGLPYNTPFVGLMLMAPCYIRLLENPRHYLYRPLRFVQASQYPEMNDYRTANHHYPLAMLDDIEIHFLHYGSEQEAEEKWYRRCSRINWDNLKVKFAMDKDFATEALLQQFESLPYTHKISVSARPYPWSSHNVQVPGFQLDAAATFRLSLAFFSLIGWLNEGTIGFRDDRDRRVGQWLSRRLKR